MIESRFATRRSEPPIAAVRQMATAQPVRVSQVVSPVVQRKRFVVIGQHGLAGANMARFLKLWAGKRVDVTLVEPQSCGKGAFAHGHEDHGCDGFAEFFPYDPYLLERRYGIRVIGAGVTRIDMHGRTLTLTDGTRLVYDRLELAPGARLQSPLRMAAAA
jgi:NADPH-dependent 2,4-dienoyl-CoA reductase/sulfur reductase-like enzyme